MGLPSRRLGLTCGPLLSLWLASQGSPAHAGPPAPIDFTREIRPILSDHCFQCHGPDSSKRKAKLRLDLGKFDTDELDRRVTSEDDSERMPPPSSGKLLSAAQIRKLAEWVKAGAPWQAHWSFLAPRRPPAPAVVRKAWVRNPIDAFVLARLERESLSPSAEEGRGGLLRRLTLDLTGLPPSLAEVDAFLSDSRPDAYERAVDRLLASPRFGERMAIRWLNAARYADTSGYQTDGERVMWRWRDWVIDAYNRNLPFDRFTIEQLAGDLIPGATLDQKIATGFNRNHRGNGEGGIIPEEYAVEYVVDRVETTATVWLGLTVGCARCHNHKFDPVSQEDFYRLFAFFNNVPENGRAVKYGNSPPFLKSPTPAQQVEIAAIDEQLRMARARAAAIEPELQEDQARWEQTLLSQPDCPWTPTKHLAASFLPDRDRQASVGTHEAGDVGAFGFLDRFTLSAWVRPSGAKGGTVLSRMVDEPRGEGYSVVIQDGKVQVNLIKRWLDDAIRVSSSSVVAPGRWAHLAVSYDGSRTAAGVGIYLDGKPAATEVQLDELNQSFATKEPFRIGGGGGPEGKFDGTVADVRIHDTDLVPEEIEVLATPDPIAAIAVILPSRRSRGQALKIRAAFVESGADPLFREAEQDLGILEQRKQALLDRVPTTMVMEEAPRPRETHVLIRGQYDRPGPRVSPATPDCLNPWPRGGPPNRLGLARWLVDPANPLAARVEANRQWQMLFGTGLVRTVEDFGAQGEPPSHPELLDWLATELIRTGWDVKALVRTIVTSATYRQASRVSPELLRRDPENRLLARGPRVRLSAEMIRDQALFLGGLLAERLGGPSVRPYQPAGLWNELSDSSYDQDHGPSLYRRGLYTFWKRTVAPPAMAAFDAPGRETCIVRETRTNTPLQALDLMNDPTFVEAARAFAARIMREEGDCPEGRIAAAFRAATARPPRDDEFSILVGDFRDQLSRFRNQPDSARALIATGESRPDPRLDAVELAAYTVVCQLILNLDETITRE
jgi:hypothetical protein